MSIHKTQKKIGNDCYRPTGMKYEHDDGFQIWLLSLRLRYRDQSTAARCYIRGLV